MRKHRFNCQSCGEKSYEMIILKDDLWKLVYSKTGLDHMCRKCIENTLERKVTLNDLKFIDKIDTIMIPANFRLCRELNTEGKRLRYLTLEEFRVIHPRFHEDTWVELNELFNKYYGKD